ncbi:hypothetical protein [Endozoicomonas numazuensis]|uniref:Uncharacterized protein n=1 Tax=Endozoicomonas numazuensis TaxID=1137799 RepID=A0A081ND76_9GAMM|nr:hypothetical protein [Endozoicomonas numazuensis]KEQ16399.1 hypothetical protein GZ78_21255 [Endozoicomonas numazuensis]
MFSVFRASAFAVAMSSTMVVASSEVSQSQTDFEQFQDDRPSTTAVELGNREADLTFSAIAGTYEKTVVITDAYIEKVEASTDYAALATLREEQGDAAYDAAIEELSAKEKKEYNEYLESSNVILAKSVGLLGEAAKLNAGLKDLDPKELAANPFKISAAVQGVATAADQITFTVDALQVLKKYNDIYSSALSYAGR